MQNFPKLKTLTKFLNRMTFSCKFEDYMNEIHNSLKYVFMQLKMIMMRKD